VTLFISYCKGDCQRFPSLCAYSNQNRGNPPLILSACLFYFAFGKYYTSQNFSPKFSSQMVSQFHVIYYFEKYVTISYHLGTLTFLFAFFSSTARLKQYGDLCFFGLPVQWWICPVFRKLRTPIFNLG
jgi:hypothetical protein